MFLSTHGIIRSINGAIAGLRSIYLDGIDAYVNQNLSTTSSTGSVSVWIKPDLTNTRKFVVFDNGGFRNYLFIQSRSDGTLNAQCRVNPTVQWNVITDNSVLSSTSWTHVVVTHNGTAPKIYIDGVAVAQTFTVSTNKTIWWNTFAPTKVVLGQFNISGYSTDNWLGKMDEFSLYETELSQSQITSIYNSGLPTSLTAYSSLVWLKCGDGDIQPTLINHGSSGVDAVMVNPEPFSTDVPLFDNKSFEYDGVSDCLDMGDVLDFERTSSFSISAWVKRGGTGVNDTIVSKMESSGNFRGYLLFIGTTNVVKFVLRNQNLSDRRIFVDSTSTITDTNWHHIAMTYNGSSNVSGINIYIDGVSDTVSTSGTLGFTTLNSSPFNIGARDTNSLFATANIDEPAVFDYELTSTEVSNIYGSGVPTDISNLSPIGWWREEDATFDGSNWTITDSGSGGNDGTSVSMSLSSRSTDVPT